MIILKNIPILPNQDVRVATLCYFQSLNTEERVSSSDAAKIENVV